MTDVLETSARTNGPVHGWFELTYSNYQVVPRVLAQSMPVEWQERFVACLTEMRAAFEHVDQPEGYNVDPGSWIYVDELSDAQMRAARVTCALAGHLADAELDEAADDYEARYRAIEDQWAGVYYDDNGDELRSPARVFVPGPDPLPHYRHGYVDPA